MSRHPKIEYLHEPFNVDHPNPRVGLKLNTWFAHYKSSDQKDEIRAAFDRLLKTDSLSYLLNLYRPLEWKIESILVFLKNMSLKTFLQPRILIKDPIALISAGWPHEKYDLTVICMVRSPFAFVGSLKKAGWDFDFSEIRKQKKLIQGSFSPFAEEIDRLSRNKGDFIDRACLLWNLMHFRIAEYKGKYPAWLFVKYEDIAMNPVQEFENIFQYLELEMNKDIRKYFAMYTSDKNLTESQDTSYNPRNSRDSLKTWMTRLTTEEQDRTENLTRDIASLFYEES